MTLAEQHPSTQQALPLAIGLTAAIVAAREDEPLILTLRPDANAPTALPSGEFDPLRHRTFEIGLRAFVAEQTGAPIGYVEQLYTFGDRGRHARAGDRDPHIVSIGYLALTRLGEQARGRADAPSDRPSRRARPSSWPRPPRSMTMMRSPMAGAA